MFQAIVNFSLHHRIFVMAAALLLIGWGVVIGRDMPIDLLPDIRQPVVNIVTEAGSLATEEVEQYVNQPLETVLNGIPGKESLRSTASAAFSRIMVVFKWGTDPFRARQMVAERLAQARDRLPDGVSPELAPMASATGMIMIISVVGGEPMATREYVDWVLRPRILALDGVAQVFPVGGQVRTFLFTPNPVAMNQLGITLQQVDETLDAFGTNSSGGLTDVEGTEFPIRNIGKTASLDDMRNLVVTYREGTPVLLSQIGTVQFAPKIKRGDAAYNGAASINLAIVRQPSANTVQVAHSVTALLATMQRSAPPGVSITHVSYNQADMIEDAIGNVGRMLRDAAIIVALVLFAFLGNVRSTAISLLAIPISLVITLIVFRLIGATINTLTLGGIAIAIGQLVDDSVVNVENILRRLSDNRRKPRPEPPLAVIADAAREVRPGILYATVVVLLVFLPLFAMPGQPGRMFGPLATAYIVSILASLAVSLTVTPALASYLFPRMRSLDGEHGSRLARWLKRRNEVILIWVLDHRRSVLGATVAAVAAAAVSIAFLPRSFLPEFNEGNIYVTLLLKPGLSLAESYRIGHLAEQIIMQVPEVKSLSRRAGRNEFDADGDPVNDNEIAIKMALDQGRDRQAVMDDIRRRLSVFNGDLAVTQFLTDRIQSEDNGARGSIVLKIFGPDLATLRTLADRVRDRFAAIPGVADLLVEQQREVPQVRVQVDYARAKLFGITPAAITRLLQSFSNGDVVSQIIENGRRFDVVIRLNDADRTPDALALLRLETPTGPVPVSSFATVSTTSGPSQIIREDGVRRIAVMANSSGSDVGPVVAAMNDVLASIPLPTGYSFSLEGSFRRGEESRKAMGVLAPIAILLIFLLLQQRFRSAVLPLIIMANIPLALVGGVAAIWITGQDLNLATMTGFIAVIGIIVRNSLLKVNHFINLHLHEGMPQGRALLLRGSAERLMPVLMTAVSAGLALSPLLLASDSAGAEILHPVAITIFGGLISSTLLDTFTTPLLYERFGQRAVAALITRESELAYETF